MNKDKLVPCIGSIELVDAVFERKIFLTLEMVHKLDALLDIGVDVLAQSYETEKGYYSPEFTEIVSKEMAYGD